MKRIFLIGAGNVATALGEAFHQAGFQIAGVYSRTRSHAQHLANALAAPVIGHLSELPGDIDMTILAVTDTAIPSVYALIGEMGPDMLIVHTSGGTPVSVFMHHPNSGVMWPVQTLSASHPISMADVPFAVTGMTAQVEEVVATLTETISRRVFRMTDEQRMILHLAATIANNFSNHMYFLAEEIVEEAGIPFDILKPIILETALKISRMSPAAAQTGAAIRGDRVTMQRHLDLLSDNPRLQAIYKQLSASILGSKAL